MPTKRAATAGEGMLVRHDVGVVDEAELRTLGQRLWEVDGVVAVLLGGSLALHGHAGHWLINEKGAVASAGRLPEAPASFAERAHDVLAHLGTTAGS